MRIPVLLLTLLTPVLQALATPVIECPSALGSTTYPPDPSWAVHDSPGSFPFVSGALVQGTAREPLPGYPPELAPDEIAESKAHVRLVWKLEHYRSEPLQLVCHYRGTQAYLARDLPPDYSTCEATLERDAVAAAPVWKQLVCR